jgi:hypothetical protein
VEHLDLFRNLIIQVTGMLVTFVNDEAKMGDIPLDTILEAAQAPFNKLPPVATMLERRRKIYQRAIPHPIGGGKESMNTMRVVRSDAVRRYRPSEPAILAMTGSPTSARRM